MELIYSKKNDLHQVCAGIALEGVAFGCELFGNWRKIIERNINIVEKK